MATGVLFLLAILLSPIALIVPSAATAPALVLVGYLMFTLIKDIPVGDVEEGLPALLTMILMPLTYDITVGIGAGFISWVLIKLVRGKTSEIHWLMWVVSIAFLVFFAQDWINKLHQLSRRAQTDGARPGHPGRALRCPGRWPIQPPRRACASTTSTMSCPRRRSPRRRPSHGTPPASSFLIGPRRGPAGRRSATQRSATSGRGSTLAISSS